jgi:hypothetical protein
MRVREIHRNRKTRPLRTRTLAVAVPRLAVVFASLVFASLVPVLVARAQSSTAASPAAQTSPSQPDSASTSHDSVIPRGQKLVLKDGSFQLVREYHIEGDRVRYYSIDSSQWEVIPAGLVDWDATKKLENEEASKDAEVLGKVHKQEEERRIAPLDIDASLEVAPGVFLPQGDGLFVFDAHDIRPLGQAETSSRVAKKRVLEEVLVPVPVVPSRRNVSIAGSRARLRLATRRPEFYMRTTDSRAPEMELIRARVHGDSREIEHLDKLFGEEHATSDSLPMQRWQVAEGVYRFTLAVPLDPGEYALAEVVQNEGMSLFVWDFGVDEDRLPATPIVK